MALGHRRPAGQGLPDRRAMVGRGGRPTSGAGWGTRTEAFWGVALPARPVLPHLKNRRQRRNGVHLSELPLSLPVPAASPPRLCALSVGENNVRFSAGASPRDLTLGTSQTRAGAPIK